MAWFVTTLKGNGTICYYSGMKGAGGKKKTKRSWCRSRFPATLMTGARWSSRREPSWRGDKRLSTQMMRSPWQRVIICRCLALPALFIFVLRPLWLGFSLRVSALCDAGHRLDQDHRGPRTRPPTNQPTNPVSTNAFRPESACFFFFSFLRAPVGLQRQQIVIESNLVLKDDSWHLSPSREKRES